MLFECLAVSNEEEKTLKCIIRIDGRANKIKFDEYNTMLKT